MSELLAGELANRWLRVAPSEARLRSQLYASNFVEEEQMTEDGYYLLHVRMPLQELNRLVGSAGVALQ